MKKMLLLLVCMLGIATVNFAQTQPPSNEEIQAQRKNSLEQMTAAAKEVGMDEKKIAKLKNIFEDLFKQQDELKANTTITPEERKEKLKALNGTKDWKVQNLLGDKYKAYTDARKRINEEAAKKQ